MVKRRKKKRSKPSEGPRNRPKRHETAETAAHRASLSSKKDSSEFSTSWWKLSTASVARFRALLAPKAAPKPLS